MARNVRGDREVARALRELARYVATPLNAASRHALRPTLSAAKANARALKTEQGTGTLANSLIIKRKDKSPKLAPIHQVGPSSHKGAYTKYGDREPVRYAHLVEFGTSPHYQPGRGVTHPGSAPQPFMTPAYYATSDQVVKRFGARIGPEMEKRAARLAKKVK